MEKIDYEMLSSLDCGLKEENNIVEETNLDVLPVSSENMIALI